MRSIVVPFELTVRLVADAEVVELPIVLHLQLATCNLKLGLAILLQDMIHDP